MCYLLGCWFVSLLWCMSTLKSYFLIDITFMIKQALGVFSLMSRVLLQLFGLNKVYQYHGMLHFQNKLISISKKSIFDLCEKFTFGRRLYHTALTSIEIRSITIAALQHAYNKNILYAKSLT